MSRVLIDAVLASLTALSIPQAPQSPPPELHNKVTKAYLPVDTSLWATISIDTESKQMFVHWRYAPNGPFDKPVLAASSQEFALGFWPTSATVVADKVVLVSGKERAGDTRIEAWTLQEPLPSLSQDPATGQYAYALTERPPLNIELVYDATAQGKDLVVCAFRNRGAPGKAFVQFWDSRDLYELDWSSVPPTLTMVHSSTGGGSVPQQSNLAIDFDRYWAGDHQSAGYLYVFGRDYWDPDPKILYFCDSDRDGTLDLSGTCSIPQWNSQGYGDLDLYNEAMNRP